MSQDTDKRHQWRTVFSSPIHWEGECIKCEARTNNAMLAHIHRDTCPGRKLTICEKLGLVDYKSPDIDQPTPEKAAAQAKEHFGLCIIRGCDQTATVGAAICQKHTEPKQTFLCRTRNCQKQISRPGLCEDCNGEDEAGVNPARSTASQLRILALCLGVIAALILAIYLTGAHP